MDCVPSPIKEFPDEEGTETHIETGATSWRRPIKEFPDEEGTETLNRQLQVAVRRGDDQRIPR